MYFILFLVGSIHVALANDPVTDFCVRHQSQSSCPETNWILAAKQSFCEKKSTDISPPPIILFYFDGAAYFSPREAKDLLQAVNLTGGEAGEPLHYGVEAFSSLWVPAFEKLSGLNWSSDVEFHYHSGDGFEPFHGAKDGLKCFNSISQDLADIAEIRPGFHRPKLVLMGHSNGGATAIGLASSTSNSVDLVLLVDPVPLAPDFVGEKLSDQEVEFWKKGIPKNVNYVADIYQQTDTGSLAGIISIRGSEVPFAQEMEDLIMPPGSNGHGDDHIRMLSNSRTVDFVSSALSKALQ